MLYKDIKGIIVAHILAIRTRHRGLQNLRTPSYGPERLFVGRSGSTDSGNILIQLTPELLYLRRLVYLRYTAV